MRAGIIRSAGTVTSAAIVMVSVFAIFASLHMIEMKELGVGLAVAVLVDALVVRVIVLPSLMMLLGKWNWWPGRRGLSAPAAVAAGTTDAGLTVVPRCPCSRAGTPRVRTTPGFQSRSRRRSCPAMYGRARRWPPRAAVRRSSIELARWHHRWDQLSESDIGP